MRRKLLGTCGLLIISVGVSHAQTSIAEMNAVTGGMDTLNSAPVGPAGGNVALDRARALQQPGALPGGYNNQIAPGAAPGMSSPAGGLNPAPIGALPAPGPLPGGNLPPFPGAAVGPGAVTAVPAPGFEGDLGITGQPNQFGQPGQPGTATPTPEPTITVLIGKRVYDAVTGALLEDAFQQTVLQSEQDKYADDGVLDNGIAGDGVRGSVTTIRDKYVGAETNSIKNRLINLVRNSENMSPMVFYGFHVMAVDPTTQHRAMPNLLEKEAQRDESLRDWNNKFLADYRVDKNDPRSEYYQLYVPAPPLVPKYPAPPGYVAPQKLAPGQAPGTGATAAGPNIYNGDPVINVPGSEGAI
ncbi:MAG: hypothetical protein ACR2IE_19925 [Candidatus Sumerlaeaceae bacterium]